MAKKLAFERYHWFHGQIKANRCPNARSLAEHLKASGVLCLWAFVVIDKNGVRTHISVGGVACLMLEPGTRVSHAAVTLASRVGCLLVWVGEAGVLEYAA